MCLPDFERFEQVKRVNALTGYRIWKNPIKDSNVLLSAYQNYNWKKVEGPHKVENKDSGIYAYNNNYNNYYNNYYKRNYYNYYIIGIIKQYGKVAIHKTGQRSQYARIDTLFSIRELYTKGPKKFLDWIKIFNKRIEDISKIYDCKVISWQDFLEIKK